MERLHKFMAHCGIASRRQAEEYILAGRVTVNDKIVSELGVKIDVEHDVVTVDGKVLKPEKKVYYLLHKPRGYATTVEDDLGRRTVLDLLPEVQERIYPAGRLDFDSEGLIVLTNDGDAAYFLTHPSCGVRKVYEALVEGEVDDSTIETLLKKGVYLGAMRIKPIMAKIVKRQNDSTVVRVIVAEGVNREVRRLFAALGHEVKRLIRLEVGPFHIDGIARGKYRLATPQEISELHSNMEMSGKHTQSSKTRHSCLKNSQPASRQGKPDPALFKKNNHSRRAPLVLNKESHYRGKQTVSNEYEDGNFTKGYLYRKQERSELGDFQHNRRSRNFADVSHETSERMFQNYKGKGVKRNHHHYGDSGYMEEYNRRGKRNRYAESPDYNDNQGFSYSRDYRKHTDRNQKRFNNKTKGKFTDYGRNDRTFANYYRNDSQGSSKEQKFHSFNRPPSRFSNSEVDSRLVKQKRNNNPKGKSQYPVRSKNTGSYGKNDGKRELAHKKPVKHPLSR